MLEDLRDRLARTRWPEQLAGDWAVGAPVDHVRELAEHWRTGYDWRAWEARLNAHDPSVTEIDGARIHLLHVRSANPDALPLILTHGWPGSVVEFLGVIEPLREDFHLVIPALPGYGFSGPCDGGWDVARIARAWQTLMAGLGYERYGAQGGDWGSAVSRELARIDGEHCVGVHLNMLFSPPLTDADRAELPAADVERSDAARNRYRALSGYMQIQARKPMSLAYGLHDSPAGQLAWIAEQFHEWTDQPVDVDVLLTNVSIYWFTGTAGSSARLYYESARNWGGSAPSQAPTGVAIFPADLAKPIRAVAERTNNIVRWTEMPRGGHFAAL
ncbi:MAG: epoxide hydrolase, partial [Solirubrobacteraceae bacterium]|nr:epoxide hydrolase [Solirubrobacteraceae bacterium]